ncbi:hypothetical protein [Cytobacillus oceanisediminis]|uniref:hypothetical protein n=1 Tax=Cytobacillus oceanisediminis TaxID=665099 RepID=UPI001864A633|nr:hypothetical protein [Cytobacillus oceanisediminis]MCM3402989.1 hypothetical protein [Cytobacillus oceanisediminis]QOK30008.1 hypothetical protein IIE26_26950 [Cytobacillus oceanisediminis]
MEKLLIFLMILASSFILWAKDIEIFVMDRGYRTVQYALEHAVHDATLQVDIEEASAGRIKFLESNAETALLNTIQKNIPVDSLLRPTSNLLEGPLRIKEIIYMDHDYIDPETSLSISFPAVWSHTLEDGTEFTRPIFGPSIVLIVDVDVKGGGGYTPFIVIQEYKI